MRRAFLCGEDAVSGRSFEHRRDWIEARLLDLAQSFALGVCGYAVMSNHTHVVLFVDREQAESWSVREVMERWHALFAGVVLSQRYLHGEPLSDAELRKTEEIAETWRERLMSVSWYMRCLNEHIARLANAEDGCTGRFWEGRFKSQAILDEAALAACLTYVDLNPVRAGMAETPEDSEFTSIHRRLDALHEARQTDTTRTAQTLTESQAQPSGLMPFVGNPRRDMPKGLPYRLSDYLELADWTGRTIRNDKRGAIPGDLPPILQRLHIEPQAWIQLATQFESDFSSLVGRAENVQQACATLGRRWARGAGRCRQLFSS
jgi:REP element-mobilizing transposase RayT